MARIIALKIPDANQLIQKSLEEMNLGPWHPGEENIPDEAEKLEIIRETVRKLLGLIQFDGTVPVMRSMYMKENRVGRVQVGMVLNLGEHWTYSSLSDLRDAQKFYAEGTHNTLVFAHVPTFQINWVRTAVLNLLFPEEKEIVVNGAVKIDKVVPIEGVKDVFRAREHFGLVE